MLSIRITSASCTPASNCDENPHQVSQRGTLLVAGVGLKSGMVITFPRSPGAPPSAHISSVSPVARLRATGAGLEVTVPANAHSGHIMVLLSGGRYTSSYGPITVFAHALHPQAPKKAIPLPPAAPVSEPASASAFEGQGMWIWYVSKSDGGSVASIIAQAHAAGVTTLYIKSSDGPENYWSQFSPQLVAELHAAGLRVCAWQYVYGNEPVGEAQMGADAVANGADCLVIDAESEYEGRYAAAQTYIARTARQNRRPPTRSALASFPYVYYHLRLPYSVFLGPGGAQFNVPQMYWKDIGNSVDTVYADTYIDNRIYGRPIFPLGQTLRIGVLRRTGALPRGGRRLRRQGHLLLGLAGNLADRLGGARRAARTAHLRDPRPGLHGTVRRQQGRPGAVDAGAPRDSRSRPRKRPASSTR